MKGWKSKVKFGVVVPDVEGGEFHIWAEDRFDARNKAVEELNNMFEGWDRAYVVDGDGDVLLIIYNYNPTNEEIAVANLVYELGDMGVSFFEWLLKLIVFMGDAPHWEVSYDYSSHSVEIELDRVEGYLRVTVWEQGKKREAVHELYM